MISSTQTRLFLASCLLLLAAAPGLANTTAIEGTILDAAGDPVPGCRVVARVVDGTEVFISPPSAADGRYLVAVPTGERYMLVALVLPGGARVSLTDPQPLVAAGRPVSRDLQIPLPAPARPRMGMKSAGGVDRLFLSFVEDPALPGRQYWELQLDSAADSRLPDLRVARLVGAFTFVEFPRVEVGLRAGYGRISSGRVRDESGAVDAELWGKMRLARSADGRWEAAVGALMTLPTGDEDAGLGADATQAEWFVAASRTYPGAVVIGHAGVASSESGEIAGVPLDGEVRASAGLGVLVPLSNRASAVLEASHDGARFKGTESDSRLLAGLNLRVHPRGRLRVAVAAGLDNASPDAELIAGYALLF